MASLCTWDDELLEQLHHLMGKAPELKQWKTFFETSGFETRSSEHLELRFVDGLFEVAQIEKKFDSPQATGSFALEEEKSARKVSMRGRRKNVEKNLSQTLLRFDFLNDKRNYQRKNSRGKNDLFLKAIGFREPGHRVLDLTCGLGRDAVYLAQQGCDVTVFERDPLLAFLFHSSLVLQKPNFFSRLHFEHRDSFQIQNWPECDAVYFDPMYPDLKQTALPRKEIQFLRQHLESALDVQEEENFLLRLLESHRSKRVVVKRHPHWKLLPDIQPDHVYEGETVSYAAYFLVSQVATGTTQDDAVPNGAAGNFNRKGDS